MKKNIRFFLLYLLIVTPLTMLINYAFAQGVLATRDVIGDFILSCLVFIIISWVGKQGKTPTAR